VENRGLRDLSCICSVIRENGSAIKMICSAAAIAAATVPMYPQRVGNYVCEAIKTRTGRTLQYVDVQ
jgi:hypothetical protein